MKSYIVTICLFVLPTFCFTQEKLTQYIDDDNKVLRIYFTTINNVNYLIALDSKDNLTTYIIDEDDKLIKHTTQNVYGISKAITFALSGSKMFVQTSYSVVVLDVIDEKKTRNGGGIFTNIEMIDVDNEHCLIKGTNLSNAEVEYSIIGPNIFASDPPSSFESLKIFGDDIFCRNTVSGKSEYYIFNSSNNTLDYLIDVSSRRFGASAYDDLIYFTDTENEVWYYDPKTRERDNWRIFSSYYKEQNQLALSGNKLVIYNGTVDSAYVELFNTDTKTKIEEWKFSVSGKVGIKYLTIIDDNILLRTSTGQMIILKQGSQEIKKYSGFSKYNFNEWPIVGDRYLIFASEQLIMVYDLEEERMISEDIEGNSNTCYDFSHVKYGDKILFSLFCVETDYKNLFYFDTKSGQLTQSIFNIDTNFGFESFSELYNLNNNIVINAQNIIEYNGAVSQINDFTLKEIGSLKASLDKDKLLFCKEENNRYYFYSYNGANIVEEGNSIKQGNKIRHIGQTSNHIFYTENADLYLFDKKTSVTKKVLTGVSTYPLPITYGNEILFFHSNRLKKIDEFGVVSTILISKLQEPASRIFIIHNGRFYLMDEKFIYSYYDGQINEIYGNESYWFLDLYTDNDNNLLLRNFGSNNLIIGDSIVNLERPVDQLITQTVKISQDFNINKDNENTLYILDAENRRYSEVAKEINASNIVDLYISKGDTIALVNRDRHLYSYKCSDRFREFKIIDQLYIGKDDIAATVYENSGNALLISNNEIFLIDDQFKLSLIPGINGVFGGQNKVLIKDNYFYFLGLGVEDGIQLYRLDVNLINKTIDIAENRFSLFPNPASNHINIKGDNIKKIIITDIQGRTKKQINQNDCNEIISIDDLQTGTYIAFIYTLQNQIVPIHFIRSL